MCGVMPTEFSVQLCSCSRPKEQDLTASDGGLTVQTHSQSDPATLPIRYQEVSAISRAYVIRRLRMSAGEIGEALGLPLSTVSL